jgi:hypothetical protein
LLDNQGYKHTLRICNAAFPQQQWLRERVSVLLYKYVARLNMIYVCCRSVMVRRFGRSYSSAYFGTKGRTQTGGVREQGAER